jgi:COMM domain containing 4
VRFKFCGDLDAPDFLLKEIDTLSKISVVRIKLIVAAIVKGLVGEEIDFDKVDSLVQKSNLTAGDVKGAVAGLDFILQSGCKHNVSDETLALELNQLGLPKEHCEALAKLYQANKEPMQARLRAQTLQLTRLDAARPLQWRVDYLLASSALRDLNAPTARFNLPLLAPNGEQQNVAFELDHDQLRVLLLELREAKAIVDAVAATQ